MKVLVTGATGFIGSHVVNLLNQTNHDIYMISRFFKKESNWKQADIFDVDAINKAMNTIRPDILIHLAWDVTHGEFWNAENNADYAEASKSLFNVFLKSGGKKIIAAGTCAEYPTSDKPVSEDIEYDGELTPYGYAKKSVYNYLKNRALTKNFEFTWFRIFGIYGEGEDERRLFPKMVRSILNNEKFEPQNPNCYFDYVYVNDVAKFIVDCIDKDGLGAINIGTGKNLSVKDFYETFKNYIEVNLIKFSDNICAPDLSSRIPDCKKLKHNNFNFKFESGFKNIINQYRN